jgi:hypothetical protein
MGCDKLPFKCSRNARLPEASPTVIQVDTSIVANQEQRKE